MPSSPFQPLRLAVALLLLLLCARSSSAFAPAAPARSSAWARRPPTAIRLASQSSDATSTTNDASETSRRQLLLEQMPGSVLAVASSVLFQPQPAVAAANTVEEDKAKILKGYDRLNYLLDNWDKLTTRCGNEKDPFTGAAKCEKTPLVVQDYIGYKNMNDPLFKADKTLRRLEDLVPPGKLEADYFDCIEKWSTTVEEASGMAYTSSWAGPQNPNGGDDNIAYYLERSQKQVTDARDTLAKVIDILQLRK